MTFNEQRQKVIDDLAQENALVEGSKDKLKEALDFYQVKVEKEECTQDPWGFNLYRIITNDQIKGKNCPLIFTIGRTQFRFTYCNQYSEFDCLKDLINNYIRIHESKV